MRSLFSTRGLLEIAVACGIGYTLLGNVANSCVEGGATPLEVFTLRVCLLVLSILLLMISRGR